MIAPCLQTTGIENGVCQYSGFSSALGKLYGAKFIKFFEWGKIFILIRWGFGDKICTMSSLNLFSPKVLNT